MTTANDLMSMAELMETVPLSRNALKRRIRAEGVVVFIDGVDRRRRLIARKDLPRLVRITPDPRYDNAPEFDGSGS
jgi:hypothetical protein